MEVNGWRLYAHRLFSEQVGRLEAKVEAAAKADPQGCMSHPAVKLLATIRRVTRETIPADPNAADYRQGNTLGKGNRHWFRAKFHERYRLFFRFSTQDRVIVYVWVNDEGSLRKSGSKNDPYRIFQGMLESGDPPAGMAELLAGSKELKE